MLLGCALAHAGGNPGPELFQAARRSYPAGPYSQVETLWGGLTTTIPVVSIKGPGGTAMSMTLVHRSNTAGGSAYNAVLGAPGAGWVHDVGGYIYQGMDGTGLPHMIQSTGNPNAGGGMALNQWWMQTTGTGSSATTDYVKRPGTRPRLVPIPGPNNTLAGYRVVSLDGRMAWSYTERIPSGVAGLTLNRFRLKSVADSHGNEVSYLYNSDGVINTVIDAAGRTLTFGYGPAYPYLMTSVTLTTPGGSRVWNFEHTDTVAGHEDWLTAVHPPKPDPASTAQPKIVLGYDLTVSLSDVRDLSGNRWHYEYGPNNAIPGGARAISAVYPPKIGGQAGQYDLDLPTSFSYSRSTPNDERTCFIADWYMIPTFSGLDDNGYIPKTRTREHVYEDTDGVNPPGNPWFRNPIKRVTDPYIDGGNKYWETFGWDYSQANMTSHSDKNGRVWTYTYLTDAGNDNSGLLWQVKDYNGVLRASYGYNSDFRLTAQLTAVVNNTTDGLRYTCTRHGYDGPTGDETSTVVDASSDGFQNGWTKPVGQPARSITTTRTFWPTGDLATEIVSGDAAGASYSDYDNGQPKIVTTPAGGTTTFTYDRWGNKLTQQNPMSDVSGSLTTWTYDDWNRPFEVKTTTTGNGEVTVKTAYDANGNVTSATPPIGRATTTLYDEWNRPTQVTQPVDGAAANDVVTTTEYDIAGRAHKVTNGLFRTTLRQYDERDLLISEKLPGDPMRKWAYNAKGQSTSYKVKLGNYDLTTTSVYDAEDNLQTVNHADGRVAQYGYRLDGRRTSSWITNIGGTTYDYNEAGELTQTVQPAPYGGSLATLQYFYVPNNPRRDSMWLKESNGGYRHSWYYQYDGGNRLQNTIQDSVSLVYNEYHPNGSLKTRYEGTALGTTYGYTEEGAIKTIQHSSSGIAKLTTAYTYDANGNVGTNTTTEPGRPTITATYAYDAANQLLSETRANSPTGLPSSTAYTYDKAGNRLTIARNGGAKSADFTYGDDDRFLSGDGHAFSDYTPEGSPKALTFPGGATGTLTYNSSEQMTQFYKVGGGPTKLEWYQYDAEGRRFQKTAQVGGVNGVARYVYDGDAIVAEVDGSGAEIRLTIPGAAFTEGGATTFLRENGVGSSLATAAPGGAGLSRTEYDAFGNEAVIQAGARGPSRFVGKLGYYSDETGLDLLGARYYVPALGRFLTRDPIGHAGGLNLYRYAENNPLTRVDPDGKDWKGLLSGAKDFSATMASGLGRSLVDWMLAGRSTRNFISNKGDANPMYGVGSWQSSQMSSSLAGDQIYNTIANSGWLAKGPLLAQDSGFGIPLPGGGTTVQFLNTVSDPFNGTQAKAGGFIWWAWRKGDSITVKVRNDITLRSLMYHFGNMSKWQGPERSYGMGFGTVRETYIWKIQVPK